MQIFANLPCAIVRVVGDDLVALLDCPNEEIHFHPRTLKTERASWSKLNLACGLCVEQIRFVCLEDHGIESPFELVHLEHDHQHRYERPPLTILERPVREDSLTVLNNFKGYHYF